MSKKRPLDCAEENKVNEFWTTGCGCCYGPGEEQCYLRFSKEEIAGFRDTMFELNSVERDLLLLGFIMENKPKNKEQQTVFLFHGYRVCRKTFLFRLAISKTLYTALCKHYQ